MYHAVYKHYKCDPKDRWERQGVHTDHREAEAERTADLYLMTVGPTLCGYDAVTTRHSASLEALPQVLNEALAATA